MGVYSTFGGNPKTYLLIHCFWLNFASIFGESVFYNLVSVYSISVPSLTPDIFLLLVIPLVPILPVHKSRCKSGTLLLYIVTRNPVVPY
ncbi:uncharacterized protein C8R40DRAFT_165545 [Lentinula edodes]|uniref:uncharacterized protein n=1 Tax=Lentinula edodes TaxID=5353 RepID=UPI001E8DDD6F|nr:uncharacterized protein C8R40DRAFT_165545 [Lentinula edodes]KAH7875871.1 hypothetical protein C8R40DRAFT_165545 [Lentinula edodes]